MPEAMRWAPPAVDCWPQCRLVRRKAGFPESVIELTFRAGLENYREEKIQGKPLEEAFFQSIEKRLFALLFARNLLESMNID